MARSAGSGLGDRGLGRGPVLERAAARGLDLAPLAVDDLDILGVADDDRPADARGFLEQIVEVAVVGAVEPKVAAFLALEVHEVLERRDAVVAHVLAELLDVQLVGGTEVKAEVDVRARDGVLELAPEHVAIGLVVEEVAEHGGEAALRGVGGLGRVLGDLLAHAEVHVAVDQAREHVQALRRLLGDAGRGAAGREQRMDLPRLHQHVLLLGRPVRKYQRAAAQYEVAHDPFSKFLHRINGLRAGRRVERGQRERDVFLRNIARDAHQPVLAVVVRPVLEALRRVETRPARPARTRCCPRSGAGP